MNDSEIDNSNNNKSNSNNMNEITLSQQQQSHSNNNKSKNEILFWKVFHNKVLFNMILFSISRISIEYQSLDSYYIGNRMRLKNIKSLKWIIRHGQWSLLSDKLKNNQYIYINKKSVQLFIQEYRGMDKQLIKQMYEKKRLQFEVLDLVYHSTVSENEVALDYFVNDLHLPIFPSTLYHAISNCNKPIILDYLKPGFRFISESMINQSLCASLLNGNFEMVEYIMENDQLYNCESPLNQSQITFNQFIKFKSRSLQNKLLNLENSLIQPLDYLCNFQIQITNLSNQSGKRIELDDLKFYFKIYIKLCQPQLITTPVLPTISEIESFSNEKELFKLFLVSSKHCLSNELYLEYLIKYDEVIDGLNDDCSFHYTYSLFSLAGLKYCISKGIHSVNSSIHIDLNKYKQLILTNAKSLEIIEFFKLYYTSEIVSHKKWTKEIKFIIENSNDTSLLDAIKSIDSFPIEELLIPKFYNIQCFQVYKWYCNLVSQLIEHSNQYKYIFIFDPITSVEIVDYLIENQDFLKVNARGRYLKFQSLDLAIYYQKKTNSRPSKEIYSYQFFKSIQQCNIENLKQLEQFDLIFDNQQIFKFNISSSLIDTIGNNNNISYNNINNNDNNNNNNNQIDQDETIEIEEDYYDEDEDEDEDEEEENESEDDDEDEEDQTKKKKPLKSLSFKKEKDQDFKLKKFKEPIEKVAKLFKYFNESGSKYLNCISKSQLQSYKLQIQQQLKLKQDGANENSNSGIDKLTIGNNGSNGRNNGSSNNLFEDLMYNIVQSFDSSTILNSIEPLVLSEYFQSEIMEFLVIFILKLDLPLVKWLMESKYFTIYTQNNVYEMTDIYATRYTVSKSTYRSENNASTVIEIFKYLFNFAKDSNNKYIINIGNGSGNGNGGQQYQQFDSQFEFNLHFKPIYNSLYKILLQCCDTTLEHVKLVNDMFIEYQITLDIGFYHVFYWCMIKSTMLGKYILCKQQLVHSKFQVAKILNKYYYESRYGSNYNHKIYRYLSHQIFNFSIVYNSSFKQLFFLLRFQLSLQYCQDHRHISKSDQLKVYNEDFQYLLSIGRLDILFEIIRDFPETKPPFSDYKHNLIDAITSTKQLKQFLNILASQLNSNGVPNGEPTIILNNEMNNNTHQQLAAAAAAYNANNNITAVYANPPQQPIVGPTTIITTYDSIITDCFKISLSRSKLSLVKYIIENHYKTLFQFTSVIDFNVVFIKNHLDIAEWIFKNNCMQLIDRSTEFPIPSQAYLNSVAFTRLSIFENSFNNGYVEMCNLIWQFLPHIFTIANENILHVVQHKSIGILLYYYYYFNTTTNTNSTTTTTTSSGNHMESTDSNQYLPFIRNVVNALSQHDDYKILKL